MSRVAQIKLTLKSRHIFIYGFSLAVLIFALKWIETRIWIVNRSMEIYLGCIAIIFTGLGIWLAIKLMKPKVKVIEKKIYVSPDFNPDQNQLSTIGLSKRELEVLELMSAGLSNQEIAGRLFVSLNTIKTHSSKVFEKLDVKRRTQAVEKAKRLSIIN